MTAQRVSSSDPRIDRAVVELRALVERRYPDATFEVFHGEDPDGTYLQAVVDVEDTDEVMDLVIDRLLDLQIEERLPVYFVQTQPLSRVVEALKIRR